MTTILIWLRLLFVPLGLLLFFVGEHVLAAPSPKLVLRALGLAAVAVAWLSTLLLSRLAARDGRSGEAKSFLLLSLWQLATLLALGLYLGYVQVLGSAPAPETVLGRLLLGAWLTVLTLSLAAGIGGEWAAAGSGRGDLAEPGRIYRATAAMKLIGMLLVILVSINYVAYQKDIQRDWSYLKVRTPSEVTGKMLKTLTEPLTVTAFYPAGNEVKGAIQDYLKGLSALDGRVKVEWLDKDLAPVRAEELKVPHNGQIVVAVGAKRARIDTGLQLVRAKRTLKDLDGEFQKAFLDVTATRKTLYFTRGHGEASWIGETGDNPLRSLRTVEGFLRQQGYNTRLFGIAEGSAAAVPDDAAAVLIVGPTEALSKEEAEVLRAYLEKGGNLMVLLGLDKSSATTVAQVADADFGGPNLAKLLAELGLKFNPAPLANEQRHVAATRSEADVWFTYTNVFTSHESVSTLARNDERVAMLLYQAGSFVVTPETANWRVAETVRSLPDTFADLNRNFRFDGGEKRDQYVVGAAATLKEVPKAPGGGKEPARTTPRLGRVVALANAAFISDGLVRAVGNAMFFADSLKWLVGDTAIQGQMTSEEDVKIRHTRGEDAVWFHGTVVVVPLLVLSAGFLATRRRSAAKKPGKGGAHAA